MESKFVVMTVLIATFLSPAILRAQQSIFPPSIAGSNVATKSDAFVVPKTNDMETDGRKDPLPLVEGRNRFTKMFQAQAAEAGDPRRIPFYLLTPFARGGGESATAGVNAFPKTSVNRPSLVKDVGALIGSLRTDN